MSVTIGSKQIANVTVIDLAGRVTLGEATGKVRDFLRQTIEKGSKRIVLNLAGVSYIDSAGLGELISGYTTVANQGGQLKLLNLTEKLNDLMQVTKLVTIFEIFDDEATAVRSFS